MTNFEYLVKQGSEKFLEKLGLDCDYDFQNCPTNDDCRCNHNCRDCWVKWLESDRRADDAE